jgi:hypothetical protein
LYKTPHGKAPPPPKTLPDMATTKGAAPGGEPRAEPPGPSENANMRGKWIEEHKVYKCGFRKMLNTLPLENTVNNLVNNVTKICYQASRLFQFHMQRIVENDLVFPDINPTYMGRLFRLVNNIFPARHEHDYVPAHNDI